MHRELVSFHPRLLSHVLKTTGGTAHGVVVAQTNMSTFSGFATTGDSDASPDSTASQFLLLRGLEPGVNEELLAKGVSKLYKAKANTTQADPTTKKKIASTSNDASLGAREGSLRRVLLIRDRKSNDSWRYGFAEFNSVEDALGAMAKYKSSDRWTISSKPVLISYIHAGVFVPVLHYLDAASARFTFSPLSNAAVQLMYWDEAAYASELITTPTIQRTAPSKNKESEHAKLAVAAAREGLVGDGKESEPKAKKRKVDKDVSVATKKIVAPHLQFWTNRHAELHGIPVKDEEAASTESSDPAPKKPSDSTPETPPSQTFADLERKCCILCSRQFKTEAEVNKHERMSQLHRDNMKNEDLVSKAVAKLKTSSEINSENSAYRDRAKERRQAFNQPKQPAPQQHRVPKDRKEAQSLPKDSDEPAAVIPSKGAVLLSKMGWTAGQGLGAEGKGRTDAITTELYSQGVGLGAEGGRIGDATGKFTVNQNATFRKLRQYKFGQ
jgi:RNA-binding protein 5/10